MSSVTKKEDQVVAATAEPAAPVVWRHKHVLDVDSFSRADIELVFKNTGAMKEILSREIRRVPTLRGKTVVNLFYEPSTRTRASFEMAAKNLSADVLNLTPTGSSIEKGETLLDTVLTLQALGADAIVIRHQCSGAPYFVARHFGHCVINAGDGSHAHPTQALLDMYTIREHLGRLEGLKIAIVGDILHSRVARSNIHGLITMGAEVSACGPPTLLPPAEAFPAVKFHHVLDQAIEDVDIVMPLRLQLERQQGGLFPSIREYARRYQITVERLARAAPGALVLHPGPMNEGVEIAPEVAHGRQSVIEEQVANGVAIRMALLTLVLLGKSHVN